MSAQRAVTEMTKYGAKVIADIELESLRSAGCLCLRCTRLVTKEDCLDRVDEPNEDQAENHAVGMAKAFNCPIAQRIYEACVDGDVAAPVTRCPMFVEKE